MSGTSEGARKAAETKRRLGLWGGLGLAELIKRAAVGECPFCGDPARPRASNEAAARRRKGGDFYVTCDEPECKAAYYRYYGRDRRERERREKQAGH